jgi:hypothetical protein
MLAALVAVAAVNLAVGRAVYVWWGDFRLVQFNLEWYRSFYVWWGQPLHGVGVAVEIGGETVLYALAPMGLAVQLAAYRLISVRGPARAFWLGFLVCGLAGAGSLVWTFMAHDAIAVAWYSYLVSIPRWGERLGWDDVLFLSGPPIATAISHACIFAFPQFLAALTGGLAARLIARWWGRRHGRPQSGQLG